MKGKTVAKIITFVLVALLLVAVVGVVYRFTNGFNESFKIFYIEHDGKRILTVDSKLELSCCATQKFNVKYTFDGEKSEAKDYNVEIVPHAEKDFEFTVDGTKKKFSKAENLNAAFALKKSETSFEFTLPDEPTIEQVLQRAYAGKTLIVPPDANANNPYPFRLVVSSYNNAVKYNVDIKMLTARIAGIELDLTHIVFGGTGGGTNKPAEPEEPENPQPSAREYNITICTLGDITNLVSIRSSIPETARGGETVTFTYEILDGDYEITDMSIFVEKEPSQYVPIISAGEHAYTFVMPESPISLRIQADLIVSETYYTIEYDTLGSGSVLSVDVDCPSRARAGDTVTFTVAMADLSDVFEDYDPTLEITGIEVRIRSGESEGEDFRLSLRSDGEYSFTMPHGDITIMFYLMRG